MKFVFDLDGTIIFSGKPLSVFMTQALDQLIAGGNEVVFASARPIRDLLPVLPIHMHQYPMVGGNGAFVADEGRILSTIHFDEQTKKNIIELIEKYKAGYLIDSEWDYAYFGDEHHPIRRNLDPEHRANNRRLEQLNELVKAVILHSEEPEQMLDELRKLPVIIHMHGSENIIDISPTGVSKWAGLQALGLQPKQFIAFGNDANDISMFEQAKHSVCVGNHADLLKVAREMVPADEGQVIKRIEKFTNTCIY